MYQRIIHCDALGVQLTASVSIINSGLGFPGAVDSPSEATTLSTLSRTVYVVPGFKSSILFCILLLLFLVASLALIVLLWPSLSHFYVRASAFGEGKGRLDASITRTRHKK